MALYVLLLGASRAQLCCFLFMSSQLFAPEFHLPLRQVDRESDNRKTSRLLLNMVKGGEEALCRVKAGAWFLEAVECPDITQSEVGRSESLYHKITVRTYTFSLPTFYRDVHRSHIASSSWTMPKKLPMIGNDHRG